VVGGDRRHLWYGAAAKRIAELARSPRNRARRGNHLGDNRLPWGESTHCRVEASAPATASPSANSVGSQESIRCQIRSAWARFECCPHVGGEQAKGHARSDYCPLHAWLRFSPYWAAGSWQPSA